MCRSDHADSTGSTAVTAVTAGGCGVVIEFLFQNGDIGLFSWLERSES
jgi:hypothetical protein